MKTKNLRKKLVMDSMHFKAILIIAIYILVTIVLSGFLMFLPSFINLHSSELTDQQITAAREILFLQKRFWPAILIVVAVLVAHALFWSHRIFGPLYRFRAIFREIAKGNFTVRTSIRKNDFLNIEEEEIQKMVSALNADITGLKFEASDLLAAIQKCKDKIERADSSEIDFRKEIEKIQLLSDKLKSRFNHFQLAETTNKN